MDTNNEHLESLTRKQNLVRDRINQLVKGSYSGLYLYGRAGTGKTHLVRDWLERVASDRFYLVEGYLTAQALFDVFDQYSDRIIVLDDVATLFQDAKAKQYLLAAMGNQGRSDGSRCIHYGRQNETQCVVFTGSIIAISNFSLTTDPRHQALASRARPLCYDPTDNELAALMLDAVKNGWTSRHGTVTADECRAVAEHVVDESMRLGKRLDMRVLMDNALSDYLSSKNQQLLTHWKDMVTAAIQQGLPDFQYTDRKSRDEQQAELKDIVLALEQKHEGTTQDRVTEFAKQTGRSRRTYYRQKKAAKAAAPEMFPRLVR